MRISFWNVDGRHLWRTTSSLKTLAILCIFALGQPSSSEAQVQTVSYGGASEILVSSDNGGSLYHYAWKVAQASADGTRVRIRGKCKSACTLYLSLPPDQVCIHRGASFSFHRAHGASATANRMGTEYMLSKYPEWVRNWIRAKGGLSANLKKMHYSYVSRFVRPCTTHS